MLGESPCIHGIVYGASNRARYFFRLQTIKQRNETMAFYIIVIYYILYNI